MVLRDLHTVVGIYVAIVAIVISLTGLIYTYVWGVGFQYAAQKTEAYDMFIETHAVQVRARGQRPAHRPDRRDCAAENARQQLDRLVPASSQRGVHGHCATMNAAPRSTRYCSSTAPRARSWRTATTVRLKTMYWLGTWNYPLHVGTIWGLPTKIIWLVTCIILMTSPVTGVWMWWERRPTGRLGLPRRVDARRPRWLVATVTATSILLPALGLSVVVVLVVEFLMSRLRAHGLNCQRDIGHLAQFAIKGTDLKILR